MASRQPNPALYFNTPFARNEPTSNAFPNWSWKINSLGVSGNVLPIGHGQPVQGGRPTSNSSPYENHFIVPAQQSQTGNLIVGGQSLLGQEVVNGNEIQEATQNPWNPSAGEAEELHPPIPPQIHFQHPPALYANTSDSHQLPGPSGFPVPYQVPPAPHRYGSHHQNQASGALGISPRPSTVGGFPSANVYPSHHTAPPTAYWHSRVPQIVQTVCDTRRQEYFPSIPNVLYPNEPNGAHYPPQPQIANRNQIGWQLMMEDPRGPRLYDIEGREPVHLIGGIGDRFSRTNIPLSPLDSTFSPIVKYLLGPATASLCSLRENFTPRFHVLRACGQCSSIPINLVFENLSGIYKVNEGVFGEVYAGYFDRRSSESVYKIVPIEGNRLVNDERQKRYHEIETEIRVSQALNCLRDKNGPNFTEGFCHLFRSRLLHGAYPRVLIEAWQDWHKKNRKKFTLEIEIGIRNYDPVEISQENIFLESDNELPNFGDDQLYVVFEYEHCGMDVEIYQFENAEQAYRVLIQVAFALAVAESGIRFEHRDLHWGNILVKKTEDVEIPFRHEGIDYFVYSGGLKSTIIDFTMARCDDENGHPVFDDLKDDTVQFEGTSDYQFEIYRMMKAENKNDWREFHPKTNIFWLNYLADKFLYAANYGDRVSHSHKTYTGYLKTFERDILNHASCSDFVKSQKQCMKRGPISSGRA